MIGQGIKASELIKQLQKLIQKHGDLQVFSSGGDYPVPLEVVRLNKTGDSYIPPNTFVI